MVHFVGAGSGAADLITVRGARLLGEADVVIYAGSLVNPELLSYTKEGCEIHNSAKLTLENYRNVMSQNHFGRYFLNSLLVGLVSTLLSLLFGALASYWIVRISHRPNPIKITILCTQMIPPVVLVIPLAIIINRLRLGDTFPALIVSYLTFNLPYVIWQLISFFQSILRLAHLGIFLPESFLTGSFSSSGATSSLSCFIRISLTRKG